MVGEPKPIMSGQPVSTPAPELALTEREITKKLLDPLFLPTLKQLFSSLFTYSPTHSHRPPYETEEPESFTQYIDKTTTGYNVHAEPYENLEILTVEYINAIADHIVESIAKLPEPATILEVGAGSGRLSHFLQVAIKAKLPNREITFVASDSHESKHARPFPVETIDYKEALKKYSPQLIVCSWPPGATDWTKEFRDCPSVKEYILIGREGDEMTGKSWETWGVDDWNKHIDEPPPYEKEGFSKENLAKAENVQISNQDVRVYPWLLKEYPYGPDRRSVSSTVSFKRKV